MRHSIRIKITFLLTISLAMTIFFCWVLNNSFLMDYYQYDKIKSLDLVYTQVDHLLEEQEGNFTEKTMQKMDRLGSSNGVSIYIFSERNLECLYQSNGSLRNYERILNSMQAYIFNNSPALHISNIENIKSVAGKYDICKQQDDIWESNYLDLIGFLKTKDMIFIRTNFESMETSSKISNNFLAIVGIIVTIIGSFVMFIISSKFTRPIVKLQEIAKKMSNLDFDVKYKVETKDEIGELGSSINLLSEKLQSTITELKSANNELLSDNERKSQIDEMRKEFLSNVTHELKTPIALIQGYAEGLQDNVNEDAESKDFYCEVIVDEAKKMNEMVKKLLTLNQIEFGKNIVEMERFDLVEVIHSVLASTDILIRQNHITVHFEAKGPCYVWADEYMIEEVITNYISNAIHHCSGPKIIEVKLIQMESTVRVAVFNTGELIPNEDLDKVWIKFFKVDKARTREYGGSGIGLSIVKAIINSHNKECGCMNRTNGVEFWFELDARAV